MIDLVELLPPAASLAPASRPELLAPAGDWDCVRAAIENGADAIYFGLDCGFNARARAANFPPGDLPRLMELLHSRGLKGYVTFNTLVFSGELNEAESLIRQIAAAGVDAVLVQDLGLARLVREICPELPIHASTQMTLTSGAGLEFARALGVERAVMARELSVREIKKLGGQSPVTLEAFVHGALCVAYSGQCLTSESFGGRSANRGQCAQACRLPYDLLCDGQDIDTGAVKYLLSPQDLAGFELIPALVEAGVRSLKIEGRLKTPEYVANITRHYREAIDAAMAGRPVRFTPQAIEEMELSFSRGFSPGWLEGCDHKRLVPGDSSSKRGVRLGEVVETRRGRVVVRLSGSAVKRGDGLSFDCGRPVDDPQGGRVYGIFRGQQALERAPRGDTVELAFARESLDFRQLWPGQAVWKTDDPELTSRLRATFASDEPRRRLEIDIAARAAPGELLRVVARTATGQTVRVATDGPLAEARQHALTEEVLREQLGRLGGSPFVLRGLAASIEGRPMAPFSVLGQLRHALVRALELAVRERPERRMASESPLPRLRAALQPPPPAELAQTELGSAELGSAELGRIHLAQTELAPTERAPTESVDSTRVSVTDASVTDASVTGANVTGANVTGASVTDANVTNENVSGESDSNASVAGASLPAELHVLARSLPQLRAVLETGVRSVYVDFQDLREYREAVAEARAAGARILLATPRIEKPDEKGMFHLLAKQGADGILVRNLGGLLFFRDRGLPRVIDFSLNVANELTAGLLDELGPLRITPSYDLNRDQLLELTAAYPATRFEIVAHQHMPMFHMEHCVFCAMLSPGTNKTNCGRPCDRHEVKLRDRIGVEHPLKADVGCRNTLFNAVPQSAAEVVPALLERGARHFRVELLDEPPAEIKRIVHLYRELLAGRVTGREVWSRLQALNRVGVTRGTLEERRDPLALL